MADKPTDVLGGSASAVEKASAFLSGFAAKNTALSSALIGTGGDPVEVYFPSELIGGCAPYVTGQEDDMAWQAGAEAADSERLHYVWSVSGGLLWYLAVRSNDLSSNTGSWCPFAALLPGMPQAELAPVVYVYEDDEAATMMSVGDKILQVHRGATTVIQVKAERVADELGGARIIHLLPDYLDKLQPSPWRSASLLEDKARRFLATASVAIGLLVATVAFVVWVLASLATMGISHSVTSAQQNAANAAQQLLQQASSLRVSTLRNEVSKFIELNDSLIKIGGWLQEYRIEKGVKKWTATLPAGITGERISEIGGRTKEVTETGTIVEGQ